jgi:hypothetical protein
VNKNILLILAFVSLSNPSASPAAASADRQHVQIITDLNPAPSPADSSKFDPSLLGGTNPVLTEQERAGVNITQAFRHFRHNNRPRPAAERQKTFVSSAP